jgi:hypothetical protein
MGRRLTQMTLYPSFERLFYRRFLFQKNDIYSAGVFSSQDPKGLAKYVPERNCSLKTLRVSKFTTTEKP